MDKNYLRRITSLTILGILLVLSFFLLKPLLMSIITGLILAFLLSPLYNKLLVKIKSRNLTATIVSLAFIIILIIPIWFLTPVLLNQSIEIYMASQKIDFVTPLKTIFPSLFASQEFSSQIGSVFYSFVTNITNGAMNLITNFILNFPTIFLQMLVMFFTFFFVLRDNQKFVSYIQSLLPFPKDVEEKLFKSSKDLTFSILYGQVVLGIIQGIFNGISFFIFGVNNALFLTLLACVAGIFPIIGTTVIWIPVAVYMLVSGNVWAALGILLFGSISSIIENVVKPMFISRRTNVHSGIVLLGMVGGLFLFGMLGVVLGPLILAYLLIILETFRDKRSPGYFIQEPEDEEIDIKMGEF